MVNSVPNASPQGGDNDNDNKVTKMTFHEIGGPKEIDQRELFVFGYAKLVFDSFGY